jgi:hypothetical protein
MLVNYTLIFVALVLFVGLAVDVGLMERNYLSLQAGANAAVAASTISMARTGSTSTATSAGKAAAAANGFSDGVNGVAVTIGITAIASSYSYNVTATVTESIAPYFLGVLGSGKMSMSAQAASEVGVPVNLSSAYNVIGIYTDGSSIPSNGGFDQAGYAFSGNLLGQVRASNSKGAILSWRGQIFSLAAANASNGVTQATVTLPHARNYSQLLILASSSWAYGNQQFGTFVVTYSDGSTASTTFSMSDWCGPQYYAGETIVSSQAYREYNGSPNYAQNYIYGYSINVDNTKTLSTLQLPSQRNVVVFAIDVIP